MNRKSPRLGRRVLLAAVLLLVALAAGHALLWRAMAGELDSGWRAWVQLRRSQGWRIEHAAPVRGGWPLAATLTLDRVRLDGAATTLPGGMALSADRIVLRIALPWIDRLLVEFPGQQRLRLGGTEFPFTADTLVAAMPLEAGTPPSSAEVTAERLRLGSPIGGVELRSGRLSIQGSSSATEEEAALTLGLKADGLVLPATPARSAGTAFGRRIESLAAQISVSGPLPPGRQPQQRAEAWRDGGGTVELHQLTLRWGPVGAVAAATLALDDTLQPMGAGTLRLTGAVQALDALTEAGVVGGRSAATARTVLPMLSRPSPEGVPEIEVPLTLEARTLALARIPVLRFPPLDWPR